MRQACTGLESDPSNERTRECGQAEGDYFQGFEVVRKKNAKFNEKSFINMAMNLIKTQQEKNIKTRKREKCEKRRRRVGKNKKLKSTQHGKQAEKCRRTNYAN